MLSIDVRRISIGFILDSNWTSTDSHGISCGSFPLRSPDAYSNIRWTLITAKDIHATSVGRRSDISSTNFKIRRVPDGRQCAMWAAQNYKRFDLILFDLHDIIDNTSLN